MPPEGGYNAIRRRRRRGEEQTNGEMTREGLALNEDTPDAANISDRAAIYPNCIVDWAQHRQNPGLRVDPVVY